MAGFREAGLAGAALALTGGVAYVIWNLRDTKKRREAEKVMLEQNLNAEKQEKLVEKEIRSETAREAPVVSQQGQARGSQVLVLGLDGAGKTSLLQCFATGSVEQEVSPTQGFHAVSINREELHIEFLEIGGEEKLRDYWPVYLKKARVLVFVLDAADSTRFPLAKTSLHRLLASEPFLPLVLLANKQDLPGACGVTELYESMALGSVGDGHKLSVLGTQLWKGSSDAHASAQDAYELILEMMNSNCAE
ncbi:ADP-ribosylation factor-like protein 9 isoform X1 [Pangasianodon hypophthalmus]|uniref:ADP-ribosylation factor-like protein 9 isoform X1 n=1 Tax=Pangasianodon hypophthalmus TaxID=310915 RepID=UPI002306EFB3|nr:ADP-ribosylation factor-like protein 9 isoform X1 [Pangasianodon hypophthalmus]